MKLSNLRKCYIYEPIKTKIDGEISTKWKYKDEHLLNVQQDVNELDKNTAGYIDFEILKLRTDKKISINKNDGISFNWLNIDQDNYVTESKPSYTVAGYLRNGRCTTYTINIYHGE